MLICLPALEALNCAFYFFQRGISPNYGKPCGFVRFEVERKSIFETVQKCPLVASSEMVCKTTETRFVNTFLNASLCYRAVMNHTIKRMDGELLFLLPHFYFSNDKLKETLKHRRRFGNYYSWFGRVGVDLSGCLCAGEWKDAQRDSQVSEETNILGSPESL